MSSGCVWSSFVSDVDVVSYVPFSLELVVEHIFAGFSLILRLWPSWLPFGAFSGAVRPSLWSP